MFTGRNHSRSGRPRTENHRSADLDTPSKIADQFAAVYNNEWREAFHALRSKNLLERSVVNILLEIIEVTNPFEVGYKNKTLQWSVYESILNNLYHAVGDSSNPSLLSCRFGVRRKY
jgi:hypothetical protein